MARVRVLLGASLLLLVAAGAARAAAENGTLSVAGAGSVEVLPDVGQVLLSISVTRASSSAAREVAASTVTAVTDAVSKVEGIAPEDITTASVSLYPTYSYPASGSAVLTGYEFQQTLQVKISNVTEQKLSGVVDAAVQAGGNNLQVTSVTTELSPTAQRSATNKARRLAVEDGTATAELLAEAANVVLTGVLRITDSSAAPATHPNPMADAVAAAPGSGGSTPTPITIGKVSVSASVSLEFGFDN